MKDKDQNNKRQRRKQRSRELKKKKNSHRLERMMATEMNIQTTKTALGNKIKTNKNSVIKLKENV